MHIPEQLEPLQAPIKDLVQFLRELANKHWEVGDKTQTSLPAPRQQPPKTRGFPGRSPFNARIWHVSMAITTSKNQIFITVCHPHIDLWKGGQFAWTPHKRRPFLLAVEVPAELKPRKLRARLFKLLLPLEGLWPHSEASLNLIINKICTLKRLLKWKGTDEQRAGGGPLHKCLVIISGCPIYLTLTIPSCHREEENMFSLPKQANGWFMTQ